jgi:hypothetical protein
MPRNDYRLGTLQIPLLPASGCRAIGDLETIELIKELKQFKELSSYSA